MAAPGIRESRVSPVTSRRYRAFGRSCDPSVLIESEAEAIRDAARRILAGQTLSSIVEEWNRLGLRTARGGPWRINSLSGLLLQERLTTPPAILDQETHARLLALHSSRRKGPRRATRRYLLTGVLRCSLCGARLRGMSRQPGRDLYVCPGPPHGGCSGTAITADHADTAVRDLVLARLDDVGIKATALDRPQVEQLIDELACHQKRLDELADMWASGEITKQEWLQAKQQIAGRAKATEVQLSRLESMVALRRLAGHGTTIGREWSALSERARRDVVHTALDHVVVLPATGPGTRFRPERLRPVWRE
ncbi:MAG: recombinase family protein [Actinobacteria bacterium]|nr:recombinase family protein [Actinomycetota bacterium]